MKYDYPDEYYVSVNLSKPILMKEKEGIPQARIDVVEIIPLEDLYESQYLEITSKLKVDDDHAATVAIIKATIRDGNTGQPLNPFALSRMTLRHIKEISEAMSEGIQNPND